MTLACKIWTLQEPSSNPFVKSDLSNSTRFVRNGSVQVEAASFKSKKLAKSSKASKKTYYWWRPNY